MLIRRLALATAASFAACDAEAQALRVSVTDSVSGAPASRVLVTAAQAQDGAQVHALTNGVGVVVLRLPAAGSWSVTARRIGLSARTIVVSHVGEGEVRPISLSMRASRFALPSARVVATAGDCVRAEDSHDRTSALWEQVKLALRAAATADRDGAGTRTLRAVGWDRELDRALRVVSEAPVQVRRGLGRPYAAADADSLAGLGYVRADADLVLQYFAPDEQSLLSAAFARTHCFDTPPADADPVLAELRFTPAPSQHVPEVAGVAYVDVASGALRRIVFRFVDAGALFPPNTEHAGGDVSFQQLKGGEWIVSGWSIRMPRMVRVSWARAPRLTGYHEVSGAVDTLSGTALAPVAVALRRVEGTADDASVSPRRNEAFARPTRDQAIVGGKLLFATSTLGTVRLTRDWRHELTDRRRFGIGVSLDSITLRPAVSGRALDLLPQFAGITMFIVPDDVPAPPRSADIDLAEGWKAGAPLPVMTTAGRKAAGGKCHVKLFVDGERTSAAVLHTMPDTDIVAMEFFPQPRDVPTGLRRGGNECGTVLLWSRTAERLTP